MLSMRSPFRSALAAVAVSALVSACATKSAAPGPAPPHPTVASLHKVARQNLCVTEGEVREIGAGQMEVDSPAMRAIVAGSEPEVAELRFVYRGPTAQTTPLANGEVRRQVAIKLRAEDTCNVVYVVWRFEPESKIVVQTKKNPGQHTHRECGDRGYQTIPATETKQVAAPSPGDEHLLQARLTGETLEVFLDRDLVWRGNLGSDAQFSGPVGIRTDNARLAFEMAAFAGGSGDCGGIGDNR
jgi:hypothetical protein